MISRFKQNMIMFEVASFLWGKICECAHWKGEHNVVECCHKHCKCKAFSPVKFRRISRSVVIDLPAHVAADTKQAAPREGLRKL